MNRYNKLSLKVSSQFKSVEKHRFDQHKNTSSAGSKNKTFSREKSASCHTAGFSQRMVSTWRGL